jgi:hypothetical protein
MFMATCRQRRESLDGERDGIAVWEGEGERAWRVIYRRSLLREA